MKRRECGIIKIFDYKNEEEFKKHKAIMERHGWHLIEKGMFGGQLNPTILEDENFKYSASYLKSDMY